ncbi:MAG: phosphoribosylanthranilate isomerase [Thermanaerothrix sp.]|nr:phosphoribosylanthranilate isomerase [Thermanaerothrix sp.]
MIRVKVCGITNEADALEAAKLGADAVGFILTQSPRRVSLERAASIIQRLPPFLSVVGVMADPTEEELREAVESRLFDYLQFHGSEPPSLLANLPIKTIKALGVSRREDLEALERYKEAAHFFLLDTKVRGFSGGTGQPFDWSLLQGVRFTRPFILAGGLGPQNITKAIGQASPHGVDINSAIETSSGIKDHRLMGMTIMAAKG